MADATFEKYAADLAQLAVSRSAQPGLVKQALGYEDVTKFLNSQTGRYVAGGLGGAGVGALVGAMQPRKKGRNALYYGTMGGLGGLGLASLVNNYYKDRGPPPTKTEYQAMFDDPNTTPGQVLRESLLNPFDAIHHSVTEDIPALSREAGRHLRQVPGRVQELGRAANDWRLRTGEYIGDQYLYPAAKGIYDWWNG